MRTIDMHAHLPGKALGLAPRETASVLAMLDKAGIDQQVVMTIDGFWYDDVACNNALARQSAQSGGRLIPFCTVNPHRDGAADEVRRCVEELGFRGVKLHPWWQGF
ncbi:MAG: amidohydrolase family protein [Chloroflexi bacterium]|nr:amidohydrolase family protein [Chloroflexota bacterium]